MSWTWAPVVVVDHEASDAPEAASLNLRYTFDTFGVDLDLVVLAEGADDRAASLVSR